MKAFEYRAMVLRECSSVICDNADKVYQYYRENIANCPAYNFEVENAFALFLSARRHALGHTHVSMGILDTVIIHPREVYRDAIMINASAIILFHNHPSGDSAPSESDIKVTREIVNAGKILHIECLDHLIIGKTYSSLRQLGYFYS